jgi:hypothetical protein
MSSGNGNTLSLAQQANLHAALVKASPRGLTPEMAEYWCSHGGKLTNILEAVLQTPWEHTSGLTTTVAYKNKLLTISFEPCGD